MELYLTSRRRLDTPDCRDFTPGDMPIETALKVLDLAVHAKKPLLLRGNEPLLYPHIEQFFASCRKRSLHVIPETTGLMPTLARKLVIENCQAIFIKVYPTATYSEDELKELKENVQAFKEAKMTISLVGVINSPETPADFVLDFARKFLIRDVLFRLPCRRPPSAMRPFIKWYCEHLEPMYREEIIMAVDCGVLNCAFTDAELGVFSRMGMRVPDCSPHLGVLPSGFVAHCWEMTPWPGKHISQVRSEDEFLQYYYALFKDLQWQVHNYQACKDCLSRFNDTCYGVGMAQKAEKINAEYEVLKKIFKNESEKESSDMSEDDRLKNLWDLGQHALMLAQFADGIDCFEEMRSLRPELWRPHAALGISYWECGRIAEAEEEFRKGARLAPDPIPCLVELHKRLIQNGNVIKARMLQGEIEKLVQQREKEEKA